MTMREGRGSVRARRDARHAPDDLTGPPQTPPFRPGPGPTSHRPRTVGCASPPRSPVDDASVRIFSRRADPERLLWSRDIRFVNRIAMIIDGVRMLELDSGTVVIGPAAHPDREGRRRGRRRRANVPEYGLVMVDPSRSGVGALPARDVGRGPGLRASPTASGCRRPRRSCRPRCSTTSSACGRSTSVVFQPIVELATGELHEYECMFRPQMPQLPQSITSVVAAAIDTERSVELDMFIVHAILDRAGRLEAVARENGKEPRRFAVNMTPASLLDPGFEAPQIAEMVRAAGLSPVAHHHRVHRAAVRRRTSSRSSARSRPSAGSGSGSPSTTPGPATRASPWWPPSARASSRSTARSPTASAATTRSTRSSRRSSPSAGASMRKLVAEGIETRADLAKLARARRRLRPGLPARQAEARADEAAQPRAEPRHGPWSRCAGRGAAPAKRTRRLAYHRGPDRLTALAYHRRHDRPFTLDLASAISSHRPPLRHHRDHRSRRRPAPGRHLVPDGRRRRRSSTPSSGGAGRRTCCATRGSASPSRDRDDGYRWVGVDRARPSRSTDQATGPGRHRGDGRALRRRTIPTTVDRPDRSRFAPQERHQLPGPRRGVHDHLD